MLNTIYVSIIIVMLSVTTMYFANEFAYAIETMYRACQ